MKVLGIVAGRHNGNSEILVKEALLACQEAVLSVNSSTYLITTLSTVPDARDVPCRWVT